ncbi:Eukaryotic mitochondrial regulator protein [Emericellopsis cladophorae]|uniref:Eukaryotic mitochondrial regulator protein n=1 Tax=Emericellopsis cladophorae TaxID=2686198 RepID=A0A9P9XZT2_9HYPO|nr:Eukaryotic mitochondrial regulator protein [Emericellopsis cladophorae]KAI6780480.1 Eukaryotic mitochondrial regulator protein [Emericellopsis cladophorae]
MPPRVSGASGSLASLDTALASSSSASQCARRTFSTTPATCMSRRRYDMHKWLNERATRLYDQSSPGPRYLGAQSDQPFPNNSLFRSQPVLSDMLKEEIYNRIVVKGDAIKSVSREFSVDVRRVGAVVRLKEVEKRMIAEGKPLATPYARAINSMLPQTRLPTPGSDEKPIPHEPINEIPVHRHTRRQLFVPVSESRHFTRADAAHAFDENLLPVDQRSFHQELIAAERKIVKGEQDRGEAMKAWELDVQATEEAHAAKVGEQLEKERSRVKSYETGRAAYRIKDVSVDDAGRDGKGPRASGWRYGAPHMDRKRGAVKIPTSVP